ncbi:MAG: DUF1800 family protein [Pseudolabrys sp.]|nr:DUF1800 family protein [Pseudolabrys sp.]
MALDSKSDSSVQAATALHRFGFAPRPGKLAAFSADPRGALLAELDKPNVALIADGDLLNSGEAARAAFDFRQERKAERLARRAEQEADRVEQAAAKNNPPSPPKADMTSPTAGDTTPMKDAAPQASAEVKPEDKPKQQPGVPQQIFLEEANARVNAALNADLGFAERLVWFWSNHFCVSADKVRAICGAFEREAIRPHIAGKFADMLMAVESHPAMLFYLDNARSIGPESFAGQRRGKGLNENLAREILELHTLGVRTGYSQADVTNFAKIITGWSIVPPKQSRDHGGEFVFNDRLHQPGPQRVMDREYAGEGFEQGRDVLLRLAEHPATAKHIAFKLARHFVADEPPSSLVDRLAKRFLDTKGDLKEVSKTLATSPEAWEVPRTKMRKPGEWQVSYLRATGITPTNVRPFVNAQGLLGEPLWRPPAPNGFSDDSAAWMDGLAQRLDISNVFARRVGDLIDPEMVADATFGPLLSKDTRETLNRAESRQQAVALLLMSPEMQRR